MKQLTLDELARLGSEAGNEAWAEPRSEGRSRAFARAVALRVISDIMADRPKWMDENYESHGLSIYPSPAALMLAKRLKAEP